MTSFSQVFYASRILFTFVLNFGRSSLLYKYDHRDKIVFDHFELVKASFNLGPRPLTKSIGKAI